MTTVSAGLVLLHLIFCAVCVPFGCLVSAMGGLHEATRRGGNVVAMAISMCDAMTSQHAFLSQHYQKRQKASPDG